MLLPCLMEKPKIQNKNEEIPQKILCGNLTNVIRVPKHNQ